MTHIGSGGKEPSKPGEMRSGAIGAICALIVPTMAFFAAPGVLSAALVGGLSCPQGLVFRWLICSTNHPPLVVCFSTIGNRAA